MWHNRLIITIGCVWHHGVNRENNHNQSSNIRRITHSTNPYCLCICSIDHFSLLHQPNHLFPSLDHQPTFPDLISYFHPSPSIPYTQLPFPHPAHKRSKRKFTLCSINFKILSLVVNLSCKLIHSISTTTATHRQHGTHLKVQRDHTQAFHSWNPSLRQGIPSEEGQKPVPFTSRLS